MFHYLGEAFTDQYSVLNVLTYYSVRAGGALVTGFLVSLIIGPLVIKWLRALNVGQIIKKDHVQDLHELHKQKSGTPTMGGLLIIIATVLSLLLWADISNRLIQLAVAVLVLMGTVGFIDDFIKLRRKHNDGLSARAKLTGQILVGTCLGLFLVLKPITYGASYVTEREILDWQGFYTALEAPEGSTPLAQFSKLFTDDLKQTLREGNDTPELRVQVLDEINVSMKSREIYHAGLWQGAIIPAELTRLLGDGGPQLSRRARIRMNRLLLESAAPTYIAPSITDLSTKVAIPGFKDLFVNLGWLYVPFVVLIMVGTSNAVNLTDGLDGLAAGSSVVAFGAFTALAYIVSRSDWSSYLFVTHIPEASELTVFGAALLGTGLGFLWFNTHPAEVFMGDTGSLALGGALGAMAILTKHELLLPIVGGLFVLEALSVIIQVGSYKLRGKRVFRMAPLHHHFELLGWSESKVTIRFWIIALMFALMSLSTLKLR
ncbi:MAG: phospho-N-acetylmuramoyl-pentapeptide-transferase [Candidatus Hydrogenedentota bacterium]|nr:MAG: phospho-N-acetylmuramoyl-pentapeptide-transferase [Candidatus Hydrogenedentota bacterium]